MTTETVHRMTAPHPPSDSAEPPMAVIRKLGFARATTNPSNQLIVLRSSRSSTEATAIAPSVEAGRFRGGKMGIKPHPGWSVKDKILHRPEAASDDSHIRAP